MSVVKYKLNNWAVVNYGKYCLIGECEGHPDYEDGHVVITSQCIGQLDGCIVTYSGSHIELGEPKADYAKCFPDAKERVFAAAPMLVEVPAIGDLH